MNGFDCGIYILKYTESVLNIWPMSSRAEISNDFLHIFSGIVWNQIDIDNERLRIKDDIIR